MKNLLFALFAILFTVNIANAQTATIPVRGNEERLALVSRTNELEASLTRNQTQMSQNLVPEVLGMMKMRFGRVTEQASSLKGDEQKAMIEKIKKQTELIADYQRLSIDPAKNKKELVAKARSFIENY